MAPRRSELNGDQKEAIVKLHSKGISGRKIAELTDISRATIQKFLKRFDERGHIENKPRSGRPKISGIRDDNALSRLVKRNRRQTLKDLTVKLNESIPVRVSETTVKRKLKRLEYERRPVRKTTTISEKNRTARVSWCHERKNWTVDEKWKYILFSDETKVVLDKDRKIYVWRKSDEAWRPECLGLYSCHSPRKNVSAMFWGCISYNGIGTLTPVQGNIDSGKYIEVLDQHLWPVIAKEFPNGGWTFQEDNCPVHVSRQTIHWKTENNIETLPWPSQSPDFNIIENVWRTIKVQLGKRLGEIQSQKDLINVVLDIWGSLDQAYIRGLYNTIPSRLQAVLKAKGAITKY